VSAGLLPAERFGVAVGADVSLMAAVIEQFVVAAGAGAEAEAVLMGEAAAAAAAAGSAEDSAAAARAGH
jgi:hypothetical protein